MVTAAPPRGRIEATTFSEQELIQFIKALASPREGEASGRYAQLHQRIRERDDHFYNRKAADPQLPPPHEDTEPYQTDILRSTWVKLKARLTENPWRVRVEPPQETQTQRNLSNDFEQVLQLGIELLEKRQDMNILGNLADGQINHCYGVLHWQLASDVWPDVPDAEQRDDLGDLDEEEKKRFRKHDEGEERAGKHVETAESVLQRDREAKARAGFPFYVETPRADQFAVIPDRSNLNGYGMVLLLKSIPLIEYTEKLKRVDNIEVGTVSINQHRKDIRIFQEEDRPTSWEPSGADAKAWGRTTQVAQIWTRDEFYELMTLQENTGGGGGDWKLVKSFNHPYEMPPFAIAKAHTTPSYDPAEKYLPANEGLYRLKPFVDYDVTLGRKIAQEIALPFFWMKMRDGSWGQGEDGKRLLLNRSAASAAQLPEGAELVKVDFDLSPAFIDFLNRATEELGEAAPQTGFVEVGASTQPWTIRLASEQANAEVRELKENAAVAINTMLSNMALVMAKPADEGGIGESVNVYGRVKAGKVEKRGLVSVDPKDIPTLQIEVDINPNSSAQQVATIEHGRQLLDDPNVPLTREQFAEDFMMVKDPAAHMELWEAEQIWLGTEEVPGVRTAVVRQALAKEFAEFITLGPGGELVGVDGVAADPNDLVGAHGIRPDIRAEQQSTLSELPPLDVPVT